MNNTVFWVSKISTTFQFKLSFDPVGGISDLYSVTVTNGEKIGTLPSATYGNKYFEGWFTEAVGGVKVTEDTLASENVRVLYAHWTSPVAIHWNATENGGTLDDEDWESTHFYYPGKPFGVLPKATGSGSTKDLDAWYLSPDGSGAKITKNSIVPSSETTYYALYVEYGDSIGRIICPTKNLRFEKLADSYEWIPDDADRTDGNGYLESTYDSQTWRKWRGSSSPQYTGFKTTVTGPGRFSCSLRFKSGNFSNFCLVMSIDRDIVDESDYTKDYYNYAAEEIQWSFGDGYERTGSDYAYDVSVMYGGESSDYLSYYVAIATAGEDNYHEMYDGETDDYYAYFECVKDIYVDIGDNDEHIITFCHVTSNSSGLFRDVSARVSNVRWTPQQ